MIKEVAYQVEDVNDLVNKTIKLLDESGNRKRLVFKAPTGSGKTVMASQMLDELTTQLAEVEKEVAIIWIAPNKLHQQSYMRMKNYFSETRVLRPVMYDELDHSTNGYIKPGEVFFVNWESINKDKNIMVRDTENSSSLYDIVQRTKDVHDMPVIVVIDEEHMFGGRAAKQSEKVLQNINPKLEIRISATPITSPDELVTVSRDRVIREEMIKEGITINPLLNEIGKGVDAGTNSWTDREYVTIHQQKYWPSISTVGNNGTSPNALGNNEPDNSDQQIASVDEVLSSWPEMMATGKRLGSPSALKTAWLYQFLDSIDARGWRCDFVTVHAYWYSDAAAWKSTLDAIHTRTKRPIWITEMNYGANWTGWPGTDTNASAANYAIEKQHMAPIIAQLDALTYVERYAYYNWVQDCRKAYNADDATLASTNYLTPMGEYYADDKPYLAYKNGNGNEFVPTSPRYNAPSGLKSYFDSTTGACTLTWKDLNGEFTKSITVERKYGNGSYEAIGTVPVSTDEANTSYSYTDNISKADNYTYRIHTINYKDENYYTNGTENFGGMTVNASDVALPKGDYTLSVKGTVSTAITVNGGKYTYTPTTTCNVRFVKKDGTVYVYEGNKYMGTVSETTPTVAATLPDIFTTFDNSNTTKSNATVKTGIYDYRNMIKNPGFETPGSAVEGGYTAPYWSCTGAGTATSWGCREYASTVCEGASAYMIHYTPKETACLSQNIGPLESNTEYQIQLNSWAYASGKNEWLTIGVGTTAGGTDIATKGISVGGSNTSAATWTFNFTTGTMTDKDVYFSLTRIAKTGDDQKNIGLVDRIVIVKAAVQGVTGTEGTTAELLEGTAVPPVLENELSETTDYTATAATDAGVTLNRTLKGNMWNTICLPFGLTSDQMHFAFGNDVKVAEFSEVSGTVFNFTTVAQTSANIPYLIFPTSAGTKYTFNKVTIESSSNELTKTTGGVDFVGTYKSETVPSDAFFISNNGFYKSNGSSPIKGFRAYFKSPSNAKEMNISVDGTTTGINGTISDKKEESVNVYDINGIIINNNSVSLKSLPKGVYIIKGKKVSVNHK